MTLQSNKYICVREEAKNSLAIIDTPTKNVLRLPVQVDSAIMNPVSKVIALRGSCLATGLLFHAVARAGVCVRGVVPAAGEPLAMCVLATCERSLAAPAQLPPTFRSTTSR